MPDFFKTIETYLPGAQSRAAVRAAESVEAEQLRAIHQNEILNSVKQDARRTILLPVQEAPKSCLTIARVFHRMGDINTIAATKGLERGKVTKVMVSILQEAVELHREHRPSEHESYVCFHDVNINEFASLKGVEGLIDTPWDDESRGDGRHHVQQGSRHSSPSVRPHRTSGLLTGRR